MPFYISSLYYYILLYLQTKTKHLSSLYNGLYSYNLFLINVVFPLPANAYIKKILLKVYFNVIL